jgi:aminoglycoside 3-N-acetyltransferase
LNATCSSLKADLASLGVQPGGMLMVHAGLRSLGPITGGVNVLVQALLDTLGPSGTLVAYVDVEWFFDSEDEPEVPVFDKRIAHAARDHGILHEVIRTWPGALRSDHPDAGVVAIGACAEWITSPHPFQYGYGEGTPLARVVEAQGSVLMLGAPLDAITLLHHAEHKARIAGKRIRRYRRLMPSPMGPQWISFEEFDTVHPCHDALPEDCFERIARAYLAAGRGAAGRVANAASYLFNGPDLVAFGIEWIERHVHTHSAP